MIYARTAIFERAELFWEPAPLTREQVDRSTISIGSNCYELEARCACADISTKVVMPNKTSVVLLVSALDIDTE